MPRILELILVIFGALNPNMKLVFLHQLCFFKYTFNLGDTSEEQGERFHQDIKTMEDRYQGRWDIHMLADYCWSLKRDCSEIHSRKSRKRSFRSVQ